MYVWHLGAEFGNNGLANPPALSVYDRDENLFFHGFSPLLLICSALYFTAISAGCPEREML